MALERASGRLRAPLGTVLRCRSMTIRGGETQGRGPDHGRRRAAGLVIVAGGAEPLADGTGTSSAGWSRRRGRTTSCPWRWRREQPPAAGSAPAGVVSGQEHLPNRGSGSWLYSDLDARDAAEVRFVIMAKGQANTGGWTSDDLARRDPRGFYAPPAPPENAGILNGETRPCPNSSDLVQPGVHKPLDATTEGDLQCSTRSDQ